MKNEDYLHLINSDEAKALDKLRMTAFEYYQVECATQTLRTPPVNKPVKRRKNAKR